jgi:hypothetical protein
MNKHFRVVTGQTYMLGVTPWSLFRDQNVELYGLAKGSTNFESKRECGVSSMSKRGEFRHAVRLPVKLAGTDGSGYRFSQTVFTHDVSMRGARLSQTPPLLDPASVVDLEYRGKKARFRVVWIGGFVNDEVGLLSLEPSRCIWGKPLPGRPISATT